MGGEGRRVGGRRWVLLAALGGLVGCAGSREASAPPADVGAAAKVEPGAEASGKPVGPPPPWAVDPAWTHPPLPEEASKRVVCDKATLKPDDGDSFSCNGVDLRILGIDTPEITHEAHGIYEDQIYGREAAAFTTGLLLNAAVVEYLPVATDPYGRTLGHAFVDGELLSVHVLLAGYAYENVSRYGDNGTPALARLILDVAAPLPIPPFQDPHHWRRENRRR